MFKWINKYVDWKLFKFLAIFYTFASFLSLVQKTYFKNLGEGRFLNYSWFELYMYNIFLDWIAVLIIMLIISYITEKMYEKNMRIIFIFAFHLFFSLVMGYLIFVITSFVKGLFLGHIIERIASNATFRHFMTVLTANFLVYFAMIGIVNVYYYINKVGKIELQKSQLQSQLSEAKLTMLKAQLHPHFVFNTLNSISSLIAIDKKRAQNLIAEFGDLLREILNAQDDALIPLGKELEILNKYIEIISIRFSDHLVVLQDIEPGLEEVLVPNMILQPLVENAIKHGYGYEFTELEVVLSIRQENNYLLISIINTGQKIDASLAELLDKGKGLQNTKARLETLCGEDCTFDIFNRKADGRVELRLKIPI